MYQDGSCGRSGKVRKIWLFLVTYIQLCRAYIPQGIVKLGIDMAFHPNSVEDIGCFNVTIHQHLGTSNIKSSPIGSYWLHRPCMALHLNMNRWYVSTNWLHMPGMALDLKINRCLLSSNCDH